MRDPTYAFEPEFDGPPPRAIPAELRVGPLARERHGDVVGLLIAGAVCLIVSRLPVPYLDWVGLAFGVGGLGLQAYHRAVLGPFEYVVNGEPLAGRVLALEMRPSWHQNNQPTLWRYHALVGFADPVGGEWLECEFDSPDIAGGAAGPIRNQLPRRRPGHAGLPPRPPCRPR